MEPEPNLYAPPSSEVPVVVGWGRLWRVEGGRLLVRDGAVLPDVCVLGASEEETGQRKDLVLRKFQQWGLIPWTTRVSVFLSDRERKRRMKRILLAAVLGLVVASATTWFRASRHAAPIRGQLIPFITVSFMSVASAWYASKLRIGLARDGWQELQVHPAAITRLAEIQNHPDEPPLSRKPS